jgi:hypothetical protein
MGLGITIKWTCGQKPQRDVKFYKTEASEKRHVGNKALQPDLELQRSAM